MASLKEVRNRIVSVGSTMQITSAMKMVSAAKLKRAQDAVTQIRPYAVKIKELLENVSGSINASENIYARTSTVKNVLIIPISSNRGLAGAFNANIAKKTWLLIKNDYKDCNVTVLGIGKKVQDAFKRTDYHIVGSDLPHHLNDLFDGISFEKTAAVAEKIMETYSSKQFDKIILIYNQFKNAAVQLTTEEQFLPIAPASNNGVAKTSSVDYSYEPNKESIVNNLIPLSLKTQLHKALLDSTASEHGARMTAMHKATDNAKEMLRDLKISYNKARQAAITTEILEIVGGAEALNG
jgi:F-type H+-transporting ATPase subunit gamma